MRIKTFFVFLIMLIVCHTIIAQDKKKDIIKFKIKSITANSIDVNSDGNEKTRNDSYQKFDANGNVIEDVEYNKDGTFKKKETKKLNKNSDPLEEIIYDEKGEVKKKTVTEYNSNTDKTSETIYDGTGKVVEKTLYSYNARGQKIVEIISDDKGVTKKKTLYTYDKNGMKSEKKTYGVNGNLVSTKKYSYEY